MALEDQGWLDYVIINETKKRGNLLVPVEGGYPSLASLCEDRVYSICSLMSAGMMILVMDQELK